MSSEFAGSSAVLDLERKRFVVPVLQGAFPIVMVNETTIWFETDTSEAYTAGVLDRLSGKIFLTSVRPEEKQKIYAGRSGYSNLAMNGLCVPGTKPF